MPAQMKDYVGNPLARGMLVCTGWRTSTERKRVGRILTFKDGWIVTDRHSLALAPADVIRCAERT